MNQLKNIRENTTPLIIALLLVISFMGTAQAITQPDAWAKPSAQHLQAQGLIPPSLKQIQNYNEQINREQFAQLSVQIKYDATNLANNLDNAKDKQIFTDTKDQYINLASSVALINGYPDNTFRPQQSITREQIATIVARQIRSTGRYPKTVAQANSTDKSQISSYAKDAVNVVTQEGIMKGYEDGSFRPQDKMTIQEAEVTMERVYNKYYAPNTPTIDNNSNSETSIYQNPNKVYNIADVLGNANKILSHPNYSDITTIKYDNSYAQNIIGYETRAGYHYLKVKSNKNNPKSMGTLFKIENNNFLRGLNRTADTIAIDGHEDYLATSPYLYATTDANTSNKYEEIIVAFDNPLYNHPYQDGFTLNN